MEDARLQPALNYFRQKGWSPFPFQMEAWRDYLDGKSGLLNAPTGSGKTFAIWFGVLLNYIQNNPSNPFCSDRCKLLDLGAWASEKFIIKGKENDTTSENET